MKNVTCLCSNCWLIGSRRVICAWTHSLLCMPNVMICFCMLRVPLCAIEIHWKSAHKKKEYHKHNRKLILDCVRKTCSGHRTCRLKTFCTDTHTQHTVAESELQYGRNCDTRLRIIFQFATKDTQALNGWSCRIEGNRKNDA